MEFYAISWILFWPFFGPDHVHSIRSEWVTPHTCFGVENNGLVVQRGEASVVEATSYIIQLI